MHILWTILIGLVAGAIAKFIMPGKDLGGMDHYDASRCGRVNAASGDE